MLVHHPLHDVDREFNQPRPPRADSRRPAVKVIERDARQLASNITGSLEQGHRPSNRFVEGIDHCEEVAHRFGLAARLEQGLDS